MMQKKIAHMSRTAFHFCWGFLVQTRVGFLADELVLGDAKVAAELQQLTASSENFQWDMVFTMYIDL